MASESGGSWCAWLVERDQPGLQSWHPARSLSDVVYRVPWSEQFVLILIVTNNSVCANAFLIESAKLNP